MCEKELRREREGERTNNISISRERFGIVFVDFEDPNRQRKLKKSASWWQQVIAAGTIEELTESSSSMKI